MVRVPDLAVDPSKVVTPKYSKDSTVITGVVEGVPIIGVHSEEEVFVLPISLFHLMMEAYVDVYTTEEAYH